MKLTLYCTLPTSPQECRSMDQAPGTRLRSPPQFQVVAHKPDRTSPCSLLPTITA